MAMAEDHGLICARCFRWRPTTGNLPKPQSTNHELPTVAAISAASTACNLVADIPDTAQSARMMRFKQLRRVFAAALLAPIILLAGCTGPTRDRSTLKAIKAESATLMAAHPTGGNMRVPKSRWPHVIASLEPELVIVNPDGVDILAKPYFDGGWGYFVPRNERQAPQPEGRFSQLDRGIYWYHPY
jgi:hypothetical protein